MPILTFTVDAALLRELGQRLVGKPYIALAELVKNGYDADATRVVIRFAVDQHQIEVQDDGHGMTFAEFRDFWMRVGTTHKSRRSTRRFQRPMTGSKGVGRLSAQFLANRLRIISVPESGDWIVAEVNWPDAVTANSLTEAEVQYELHQDERPFSHGTRITLSDLQADWGDPKAIQDLAGELWWLQPPFRATPASGEHSDPGFKIEFHSSQERFEQVFAQQMSAILGIWTARLVGRNEQGMVSLSLEFAGEAPQSYEYRISELPHNRKGEDRRPSYDPDVNLTGGEFEIRIFKLEGHQSHGIRVGEARNYFSKYGGVHVYDGGFRLPYYGNPQNDWLGIEFEHSHRRFVSQLLPAALQKAYQETERLRYLPTLGRIFGVMRVDTSREPHLAIMITRDRLAETEAFQDLVGMVRYAFHLYAYEEARRRYTTKSRDQDTVPVTTQIEQMAEVLAEAKPLVPDKVHKRLDEAWRQTQRAMLGEQERLLGQVALLGPLATAGIATLALQHELRKQFAFIDEVLAQLRALSSGDAALEDRLRRLSVDLATWLDRARGMNDVFGYLLDAENVKERSRFGAATVVEQIVRQTGPLTRGVRIDTSDVDRHILLPKASFAEWGAILQNVFINAFNAMLDREERVLAVSTRCEASVCELLVQDTGVGVDLAQAERLFEPFERGRDISPTRRALGYGGSGLGLTIVRLLTGKIGCEARFVSPGEGFATAFSIRWKE